MTHQAEKDPKATIRALQEQFRDLCVIGMRGATAITDFRDDPAEKLQVVKDCTAMINDGLAELRQDLERSLRALSSGEMIFQWEYEALEKIAVNVGFSFEEIQERITVQNGSIVTLDLDYTVIADLGHVSHLTALKKLRLVDTPITDISPLATLTALRWLELDKAPVKDITPLAHLTALEDLWLNGTQVSDIIPLANLSSLVKLWLDNTPALTSSRHIITTLENRGVNVFKGEQPLDTPS